jgi:hypothetical protein
LRSGDRVRAQRIALGASRRKLAASIWKARRPTLSIALFIAE